MSINKRLSVVFLAALSIMNIASGVITQLKILTADDITSIIPIKAELTVNQILMLNFMCVSVIITLITVVATYLTTDIAYSPLEILKNCPGTFLIIPAIILFFGVFNAFNAEASADKIAVALCSIIYFALNFINFGCIITVVDDAKDE